MKTQLIYLDDSYQKEMDAKVLEVLPLSQNQWRIVLDKTIFYALGGGQPFDQGDIIGKDWKAKVIEVLLKDGEIWHYIKTQNEPKVGESVHGIIDWKRRYKNMRYHTAGHIVDFALYLLGYSPKQLMPGKADHGKNPYIMYYGILHEDIKQKLQEKVDELITKDLKFSWTFQPLEDLQKEAIYLQASLPKDKPLRTLRLETVGAVADGGTQLHSTAEAGKVVVDSIKIEEDTTIIRYSLSA